MLRRGLLGQQCKGSDSCLLPAELACSHRVREPGRVSQLASVHQTVSPLVSLDIENINIGLQSLSQEQHFSVYMSSQTITGSMLSMSLLWKEVFFLNTYRVWSFAISSHYGAFCISVSRSFQTGQGEKQARSLLSVKGTKPELSLGFLFGAVKHCASFLRLDSVAQRESQS